LTHTRRFFLLLLAAVTICAAQEDDFRAYTESPRLFLRPQRLRLLKRERERQSIRWQQLDTLVSGKVPMVEPGFAYALFSRITGREEYCRQAERGVGTDLRQMAIVYDWCQTERLVPILKQSADKLAMAKDVPSQRNRALAAIALAEVDAAWSEKTMRDVIVRWWRGSIVPTLKKGAPLPANSTYALFELLHVVRDNLNIDLRDQIQGYFRDLPLQHLLSYYPAAFPGAENEFRIPYYAEDGEPDLKAASLSRAAELAMVAYDSNPVEIQALQSWLLQDRFLMRGAFGIVYEYLWANPYQPGITFHVLPNLFHDKRNGRLFIRSSWEEDATFFCYDQGKAQVFDAGKRADVNMTAQKKPIRVGMATIIVARDPVEFEIGFSADTPTEVGEKRPDETWFVVGLKPNAPYDVEPDSEEMFESSTDSGGIASFQFAKPRVMTYRMHEPRFPIKKVTTGK